MMFEKICCKELNSRQKENYNFAKVAAQLAADGYNCMRPSDDWQGADFIAMQVDGVSYLRVQLRGCRCRERMQFYRHADAVNLRQ